MYQPHEHNKPINCHLVPYKDTMIPYMALTRQLLISKFLQYFLLQQLHQQRSTTQDLTTNLYYPHDSMRSIFLHIFLHFLQSGTHSFRVHFMNNTTHIQLPLHHLHLHPQLHSKLFPSPNHICRYNPFHFFSHSTN